MPTGVRTPRPAANLYSCSKFHLYRKVHKTRSLAFFLILVCEAVGTAATPGLLCQPRVIVKMIVEKQMDCRLAGETEVLGESLPQRRRGGKPATNLLSYGAARSLTNAEGRLMV
jgi:hypothetical protein